MEKISGQLQDMHRALENQLNKLEGDIEKLRKPDESRSRHSSFVESKGTIIS